MIHQNPSCGVPQLKDVLQDPDANWSQIREAMKSSSGGCTNAAIVGALASRAGGGAVALSPDDDNIETKSVIKASTVKSNNNNTAAVVKDGVDTVSPLRAASFSETMTNDAASVPSENTTQDVPDDKTNSQNRRPARRSLRRRNSGLRGSRTSSFRMSRQGSAKRGLLVGTHNSSFRSQMSDSSKKSEASSKNKGEWAPAQLGSFNASVNMMDFGIDHTRQIIEGGMDTLSETHSLEDGMSVNSGRRQSSSICSSFSGSFLGWNNDDDSTSELFSSGVLHSSLSHLVDSSGFLDWDHRTKDTPPVSPLRKSQNGSSKQKVEVTDELASNLSRHISHAMSGDGYFLCSSFHSNSSTSSKGEKGEEEWNIEDYENPLEDNAVRAKPLRGSFFRNQFNSMRRCSQEKETTINTDSSATVHGEKKEGIHMNDIKEALLKVANEKKSNDGNNAPKVKPKRRRQTIVGMNPFLGGSESKNDESDASKSPPRRATLTSLPGISQLLLSTERSPDNKPPAVSALSQMSETDDNRTAIWINKTDGGFDIDEERRKLYEEQDNKSEPQKKGGFFRRGSVERNV